MIVRMEDVEKLCKDAESDDFYPLYRDIANLIGKENAIKLYIAYRGSNINFPMKILSKNGFKKIISKEYNGKNLRELSLKYGYSDKYIRNLLSNEKKQQD